MKDNTRIVKSFPVISVYYFQKGKSVKKDDHQMWFPKPGEHTLNIDDRGEFYLGDVHYVDFRGISLSTVPNLDIVYVTLAKNKHPGVFDVGIQGTTLDELCKLRSPNNHNNPPASG